MLVSQRLNAHPVSKAKKDGSIEEEPRFKKSGRKESGETDRTSETLETRARFSTNVKWTAHDGGVKGDDPCLSQCVLKEQGESSEAVHAVSQQI